MPTTPYSKEHEKLDIDKVIEASTKRATPSDIERWDGWYQESKDLRTERDRRWAKNIELIRGIWPAEELNRSKVRRRSKIFFRKIWASNWRILAAMHDAFLREADQFRIVGRNGEDGDEDRAAILQIMTEYRRDIMMRTENLFLQLVWSIMSILDLGWACGKLCWKYKKKKDGTVLMDKPEFTLYPNEQVFPDLSVSLPNKMRFLIFENYMTKEDIEEEGWSTEGLTPYGPDENIVRSTRNKNIQRDSQNIQDDNTNSTYPAPGQAGAPDKMPVRVKYCVREIIYRDNGKMMMAIYSGTKTLVGPMESPYGDRFPSVFGQCLTMAHQLMGEGFPEAQEGPQTSLNVTLNQRKDNVSVMMNGESIVDRYANVDLEALRTSRPANIILSDNTQAVQPVPKQDVTQNAWMEAQADQAMMDETSGVTPGLMGLDKSQKATTSQINFSNSGAKMGLFISIVAQTFFRDFFSQLAYMIQRFETDENIFRVANRVYRKNQSDQNKPVPANDIETIDDFVADVDIQVQPDLTTKEQEVRNWMLIMDRALMSNQAMVPLVQAGVVPQEGVKLFDISKFMEPIMKRLGEKDLNKFIVTIPKSEVPPPIPPGGSGGDKGAAGANTAQAETPDIMRTSMQEIQGGASNATGPLA